MQKYDDLPRCNSQQTNGFFLTLGVAKTYEYMLEEIPERLEAVDELETIVRHINEMHRVSEKLIATYPEKKQNTMLAQTHHLRVALVTFSDPNGVKGYTYINTDVLGTLLKGCHEQCLLCPHPGRCNTCEYGKAFDRCCPYDRRKGESWADINVAED